MIRRLENLSYEERLRGFSLEEKRLQGDLTANLQYLEGADKKDRELLPRPVETGQGLTVLN